MANTDVPYPFVLDIEAAGYVRSEIDMQLPEMKSPRPVYERLTGRPGQLAKIIIGYNWVNFYTVLNCQMDNIKSVKTDDTAEVRKEISKRRGKA